MIAKVLRLLGKTDRRVVAVFANDAPSAHIMVSYVRANLDLPIWLYAAKEPDPETAARCATVAMGSGAALWIRAQRELWPYKVALAVTEWNGRAGGAWLKVAPLTIPLFRALIRNEDGGYFPGSPAQIVKYAWIAARSHLLDAFVYSGEVAFGAVLWVFSFFAQFDSAISRAVFSRFRPTRTLELTPSSTDTSIAVHRYRGREWKAGDIVLHDARYLFFQRDDDSTDPAALLGPFRDESTFAVSRQYAFRGWRKLLFATAPFRALDPGERTCVRAPVSAALLVDLAKLRALGVPRLSSFGSNWYLLFHQAAAAGWHSYSVGTGQPVANLPAVPFDEAEFVKTLLAEPALRALAPRNPALSRGNIAQSIAPGPGFRGLPRVAIVSPYLPFPLSHGGAVRIWNLCRALADRIDFILICFREASDAPAYAKLHEVFREVYVVDIDEKHHGTSLPKQVNGYESSTMRALIAHVGITKDLAAAQFEYTQMAAYREAAPNVPAILVEHDLTFMLYRQLSDEREYKRWLTFERERLQHFEIVWTMSELDRATAIQEGCPAERTLAIPNGVDLERFRCPAADPSSRRILYVGSFRHLPNYLAFEELRTRLMPAVWTTHPDAMLDVVAGPHHTDHWPGPRELDPRITVHGFVEDLIPLYTQAAVVVVPLPVSAGTNIKLMEALSCARPVVSTPVGCAGLELVDGDHLLIRNLGADFSSAMRNLLSDKTLRETLARNGRSVVEERFSWKAIAETVHRSYTTVFRV